MSKLPTFDLADIPKDWDIELDVDFVRWLDTLNRPWHYAGDGKYIPGRVHNGRVDSAPFWEAGWYSAKRARYRKLRTKGYFKRQELFSKLWGYHRFHDAHTTRFGHIKECDRGNWIKKTDIPILRKPFGDTLTDSDIEELVTGVRRAGFCPHPSIVRFKRLPIAADKWWAWLLGFYFSSGCIFERRRYYKNVTWDEITMVFAAHEDVIPLVASVSHNIGNERFFIHKKYCRDRIEVKDKGLGTTVRARIHMGSAVYLVLKKFGLPTEFKHHKLIGGGSRVFNPRIPEWVKENDEFMLAFLEGYINGAHSCSHLTPIQGMHDSHFCVPNIIIYINCNGRPENYIKNFLLDIRKWLGKQGVKTEVHKDTGHKTKGNVRYILSIGDKNGRKWLLDNLDIEKPELRARLFVREEADKDPVLYEVLREIRTPDNVILGLILEQPRTEEQLRNSLQMRSEGISESLQRLKKAGIITTKEEYYCYEPDKFVQRKIAEMSELQAYLKSQIWKYSDSLLYQCQSCQKVYIRRHEKCRICRGPVQPTSRTKVLRHLVSLLKAPRNVEAKLKQHQSP